MIKNVLLLCFVTVLVSVSSKNIKFGPCPDQKSTATVSNIAIVPCDVEPCILYKGKSTNIMIDFTPTKATNTLKSVVKGKIGPLWIPFPLDHDDACTTSGVTCPLVPGKLYHFNYSLPVKSEYPSLQVLVKWEFHGDESQEVVCDEFPVKLQ
ncbi:NPC intracellular cholesterol transporter 2-like [Hydractinia symbiolongicarpus]|uniref:NPC intracellular cholesterol transporter 2-like n=1 Tax=Hydractinia symbiolongicarpus TaxID=13093 RepID=UPI00254DEDA7|nr:NPC intracellular cholesterol transporter 2-like [Hydractinia symbiolongicarpus]